MKATLTRMCGTDDETAHLQNCLNAARRFRERLTDFDADSTFCKVVRAYVRMHLRACTCVHVCTHASVRVCVQASVRAMRMDACLCKSGVRASMRYVRARACARDVHPWTRACVRARVCAMHACPY